MLGNTVWANLEEDGRVLAQAVYDRPDGKDSSSRASMILTEKGHAPRQRRMYLYRLEKSGGESLSLIRFTDPPDIKNTGLLTKNVPGEDSDQSLYLPALKRARRISSSRKGGRFVGSDYYYEDLRERAVSLDRHRYLGEQKLGRIMCKVLESIPVDPDNSAYSKRVSWIHPRTLIPLRVDYYVGGANAPIKRLNVYRIQKIQGYWTVTDTIVHDLETGHQTRLRVDKIVYDRGLSENLFSRQFLTDPAKEARYRP